VLCLLCLLCLLCAATLVRGPQTVRAMAPGRALAPDDTPTAVAGSPTPTVGPLASVTPVQQVPSAPTAAATGSDAGVTPVAHSSVLVIFTTAGCIVGVLGLLAVVVAWIALVSDGWGPLLTVLVLGNRRGKRRFRRRERQRSRVAPRAERPEYAGARSARGRERGRGR
jgi:hypothetical protein